jgi:hypothetical protein
MPGKRGASLPRLLFCGICLICLCVVMYALGSTMTLWTMQFALDHADNPVLEGFSLPALVSDMTPAMPATLCRETSTGVATDLNEHSLLRPPNAIA